MSSPIIKVAPHAGAWIETITLGGSGLGSLVAPHAGAWIETNIGYSYNHPTSSNPMRVRGLKQGLLLLIPKHLYVAPHAGAWIETLVISFTYIALLVAPHAGAWIETGEWIAESDYDNSRTPCGCVD